MTGSVGRQEGGITRIGRVAEVEQYNDRDGARITGPLVARSVTDPGSHAVRTTCQRGTDVESVRETRERGRGVAHFAGIQEVAVVV